MTTTTTNPSHPRKTSAMRAQEDAAAASPSRITKYVFIYSQFVYFYYFTSFLFRNAAILEESGITVTPPECPKTTMPTPATSTSIPKPTHLRRADVVTTNPESMQIKTVISVLQLCAYIFAILFEFSGIFNRLFRLNFLYFRRNTALSIESGRTAFVTSPP